jgi:hypothetical protein
MLHIQIVDLTQQLWIVQFCTTYILKFSSSVRYFLKLVHIFGWNYFPVRNAQLNTEHKMIIELKLCLR